MSIQKLKQHLLNPTFAKFHRRYCPKYMIFLALPSVPSSTSSWRAFDAEKSIFHAYYWTLCRRSWPPATRTTQCQAAWWRLWTFAQLTSQVEYLHNYVQNNFNIRNHSSPWAYLVLQFNGKVCYSDLFRFGHCFHCVILMKLLKSFFRKMWFTLGTLYVIRTAPV